MISIHTNLSSLTTQNTLNKTTNKLNQAIERMSTGYKINHAGDNAANYSITNDITAKIGSYEVAEQNTAMGLDLVATASGALDEVQDRLARLRALTEQASNGTYGEDSLAAIQAEANAIIDEIERVFENTEYNGINLAKGNLIETLNGGFIKEINRRNTDNMTALSSINPSQQIESGTYKISTAAELAQLATMTNNGLIGSATEFVLADDIDLSDYSAGEGWTPIGCYKTDEEGNALEECEFRGVFDGNGYKITNLTINRAVTYVANEWVGLFGIAGYTSHIENLGIEDADIKGSIGGILSGRLNSATISNCYTTGNIKTANRAGGIASHLAANITVDSCYSTANITGSSAGGLFAYTHGGTYINCYYDGTIAAKTYAGGLLDCVASGTAYFYNCYSSGNYSASGKTTSTSAGGFVGSAASIVAENCYSSAKIIGDSAINIGGIVGAAGNADLKNCSVLNSASAFKGIFIGRGTTNNITIKDSSYNSAISISNYVGNQDISEYTAENITTNSGEAPYTIDNNADINIFDDEIKFQVGINGDESSRVIVNSSFDFIAKLEQQRSVGKSVNTSSELLNSIDILIKQIAKRQTEYGAAQNRLESALDTIQTSYDNLVSSRSTLRDADMGKVSSEFVRYQILQQAAATLMSTANQSPSIALQLI